MRFQAFSKTSGARFLELNASFLVFRDSEYIFVKKYIDPMILNIQSYWKLKLSKDVIQVLVGKFKNHLKKILNFPFENYNAATKRKIEFIRKLTIDDIKKLEMQKAEAKPTFKPIQDPGYVYSLMDINRDKISSLEFG